MKTFFATFGAGHSYSGCYVEIIAEDHHAARACMIRNHGDQWSNDLYQPNEVVLHKWRLRKLATLRQKVGDRNRDGSLVFNADRERAHV